MFESLQTGLRSALKTLHGKGKLTEANMRDGLRLVEQALLEADVSYSVVKDFIGRVTEKALGEKVLLALDPDAAAGRHRLRGADRPAGPGRSRRSTCRKDVTVLMLCGLQGSGKTTTCGKLAKLLQQSKKSRCSSRPTCSVPRPSSSCT